MSRATSVRPATADDTAAIITVYLEAWRAGYEGILDPAELEVQAQKRASYDWHGAITRPERVVFVAEHEFVIVGVAECEPDAPTDRRARLQILYLVPGAWGTGAAAALVDASLAEAHRAGRRAVWLELVQAQARARRFYEREGWRLDASIPPVSNGLVRLLHYRHDVTAF
ncbi:MAG TPA: GNAT family N-acetyltransferase [Acidimicrobiales bacterium]|nr:GNAT family N-acetyltransferase [Acidimicrobiales bacterium]